MKSCPLARYPTGQEVTVVRFRGRRVEISEPIKGWCSIRDRMEHALLKPKFPIIPNQEILTYRWVVAPVNEVRWGKGERIVTTAELRRRTRTTERQKRRKSHKPKPEDRDSDEEEEDEGTGVSSATSRVMRYPACL